MPPKPKGKKIKPETRKYNEEPEREIALQTKLEQKIQDLTALKMRVKKAEEQHKSLDQEAHRLQIETSEYKRFMLNKKNLRQTHTVTLSDYHHEEIEDINQSKDNMIENYQQKKKEFHLQLIEKSQLLLEAQHELEEMDGYRIIRDRQSNEIKRLEQEVKRIRAEHVHEIDRFKLDFQKEIEQNRTFGNIKLKEIEKQAKFEAEKYLYERTINIQNENTELRIKIRNILKRRQELNKSKEKLENEQLYLIAHVKLITDLKKIRLDKTSINIPKKSSKLFYINAQKDIQYLIFEGGGPDEGPGPNQTQNIASLKRIFGEINSTSHRMYAYGKQQMRVLTRSIAFIRSELEIVFDLAEVTNTPLFIHIDPIYGWGADEENSTDDAPVIKYWKNETMREWIEFPSDEKQLPNRIPRTWFNWGSWCSPSSAFPAIGAPNFLNFSLKQFNESISQPLAHWLTKLNHQNRSYLFAGINIGWETNILNYRQIDPVHLPTALWPLNARNITMQSWEAGAQLGYASLHWQGWTEDKLIREALHRNLTRDALFNLLCYEIIHDYLQILAEICYNNQIPKERIYTHIVPMASIDPSRIETTIPPIWTAVNTYSIPGFTMDNRGAAIYNLTELKHQIILADPSQIHFAVSESYLFNYGDEESMRRNLAEAFDNGALMKAIYGALPFTSEDPEPIGAIKAIRQWLNDL